MTSRGCNHGAFNHSYTSRLVATCHGSPVPWLASSSAAVHTVGTLTSPLERNPSSVSSPTLELTSLANSTCPKAPFPMSCATSSKIARWVKWRHCYYCIATAVTTERSGTHEHRGVSRYDVACRHETPSQPLDDLLLDSCHLLCTPRHVRGIVGHAR